MSPYLAGGLLIAFLAWSGFMYHEGSSKESAVCGKEDAQHDLAQAAVTVAAEKSVIATVSQQQTVTQGASNAYESQKSNIDSLYVAGVVSLQPTMPATRNGIGTIPGATCRPDAAAARPLRTKVYKLSAQECDDNTAQLYGLQEWVKGQQAIKPSP